jgi:GDP-L-fucose synthase
LGALVRRLAAENVELLTRQRNEIDLRGQAAVDQWLAARRPHVIFLAAGKVAASPPTKRCAPNSSN